MSLLLLALLAALTYGSRAAALVLMPAPPPRLRAVLERLPAPLFAGLAVVTLLDAEGRPAASIPTLTAVGAALLATPRRSLPLTLAAGLIGYAVGGFLLR